MEADEGRQPHAHAERERGGDALGRLLAAHEVEEQLQAPTLPRPAAPPRRRAGRRRAGLGHRTASKWSWPRSAISRSPRGPASAAPAPRSTRPIARNRDSGRGRALLEARRVGCADREEQLVVVAARDHQVDGLELLHDGEGDERRSTRAGAPARAPDEHPRRAPGGRRRRRVRRRRRSRTSRAPPAPGAAPRAHARHGVVERREQATLVVGGKLRPARAAGERNAGDPPRQAQARRRLSRMAGDVDDVARPGAGAGQGLSDRPAPERRRDHDLGRGGEVAADEAARRTRRPGRSPRGRREREILAALRGTADRRAGRTRAPPPSRRGPTGSRRRRAGPGAPGPRRAGSPRPRRAGRSSPRAGPPPEPTTAASSPGPSRTAPPGVGRARELLDEPVFRLHRLHARGRRGRPAPRPGR